MTTSTPRRLNYIGSKYQLLEWLTDSIKEATGLEHFKGKRVADLFSGTGIVSHHFRALGSTVLSNDAELYSAVITRAFTRSVYTERCKEVLEQLQRGCEGLDPTTYAGYIARNYSPFEGCERMFFTVENARRIDYCRGRLEELKAGITEDEYAFLLASLIVSADAISNVPAVYGCYLKKFKAKALAPLTLKPIHTVVAPALDGSTTTKKDVLDLEFLRGLSADIVYLDPPYNERQYSKNYFPLNMIAKSPWHAAATGTLKGKTGIPADCFLSPFCARKAGAAAAAFETIFKEIGAGSTGGRPQWIFLSYNSESLVGRADMEALMQKYGTVTVFERDYKRFKSFEYNQDAAIKEYLFCLRLV